MNHSSLTKDRPIVCDKRVVDIRIDSAAWKESVNRLQERAFLSNGWGLVIASKDLEMGGRNLGSTGGD